MNSTSMGLRPLLASPDLRACGPAAPLVRAVLLAAALASAAMGTACNTTEGVGKDVQAVGEGIEEGARDARD